MGLAPRIDFAAVVRLHKQQPGGNRDQQRRGGTRWPQGPAEAIGAGDTADSGNQCDSANRRGDPLDESAVLAKQATGSNATYRGPCRVQQARGGSRYQACPKGDGNCRHPDIMPPRRVA